MTDSFKVHEVSDEELSAVSPAYREAKGNYEREFVLGYITAMLWSSTDQSDDQGGLPLDDEAHADRELALESCHLIAIDCRNFVADNAGDLGEANLAGRPADHCGHDFWLTTRGHGAGFWDRGMGATGDRLTEACKGYSEESPYIGDDGLIYLPGGE